MRLRVSLCTAAVFLLGAWLAVTTVVHSGSDRFVLEVPATYLSVGQQFQPRLVSLADDASNATQSVSLELWDAAGQRISSQKVDLAPAATSDATPIALPRAGRFQLRAGDASDPQTITLQAMPEPAAVYGGVVSLASLGVASGVADYLRQHSFAVTEVGSSEAPAAARVFLVGDARLDGDHLAADYSLLWRQVAEGAQALLLEPPPPGVASYWPLAAPLQPVSGACGDDLFEPALLNGLVSDAALATLLRPNLVFDLAQQSQFDLYHWDGTRLARPNRRVGYSGCHPLFSYRYGEGWVTVSDVPLLQHFQDARARLYLMNLIKAVMRRKRSAPASPGLQWVVEQRLKALAQRAPDTAAAFYRPAPVGNAAAEPAAVLAPDATDATPQSCWNSPSSPQAGATMSLDLRVPQLAHTLTLDFGSDAARRPTAFRLEGSPDGSRWSTLPTSADSGTSFPLAPGPWQAFRLIVGSDAPWRVCRFSVQ